MNDPVAWQDIEGRVAVTPFGCFEWGGSRTTEGYGRIQISRHERRAHRVAYELLVGPIPAGLQLDHLCRNRACVNPDHLEPVSSRVNTLRGVGVSAVNARKVACPRGHTSFKTVSTTGERYCPTCLNERRRVRRQNGSKW